MRKNRVKYIKYSALFIFICFCIYCFLCLKKISNLDLLVNPNCKECFAYAKNHAGCAIFKNKRILIVKDSWSKSWGFPAGHHDFGERAFQTAYRETLEETGIKVYIDKYITEFKEENFRLFKCDIFENSNNTDGEIIDKKWVSKKELKDIIDKKKDIRFLNQFEYIYNNFDNLSI